MKLALILLAVSMLVFSGPVDKKRFLEFLRIDNLVQQLRDVVYIGMGHAECVKRCDAIAGPIYILCDAACTKAIATENEYQMDKLAQQLQLIGASDMGHAGCVNQCHTIASIFSLLCDGACTKAHSPILGGRK